MTMTNDLTEKYLEIARKLANDAHCRYCDYRSDPRTKCDTDIADLADAIVKEMKKMGAEALEWAAKKVCSGCHYDLPIEQMDHLDIHIFKDGSKRACQAQAIREAKEE